MLRRSLVLVALAAVTWAGAAAADPPPRSYQRGYFLLSLDGAPSWVKRVEDGAEKQPTLTIDADELTTPEVSLVDQLLSGLTPPRPFVLQGLNGKRKGTARLVAVRLPAVGLGAPAPVQLVLATEGVTKSLFSAEDTPTTARGRAIAGVRASLDGAPVALSGVEAFALREKAGAAQVQGDVALTVPTSALEPFKRGGEKAPHVLALEYVDDQQARVLAMELVGCRLRGPVKPSGSPTTRLALECTSARKR